MQNIMRVFSVVLLIMVGTVFAVGPAGLIVTPVSYTHLDVYKRQDLERYAARLEQAQRDCKDRFRKDILFRMKDDIFNARRQFRDCLLYTSRCV